MYTLTEDIEITLINGQQLSAKPRILPDSLMMVLTTQDSIEGIEKEMMDAIGSVEDWLHMSRTDTLAFDAGTGQLKSVSLYYPEQNVQPDNLKLLASAENIDALPVLDTDAPSFELIPFAYRYYHEERNLLVCFEDTFMEATQLQEVRISPEVSLFFSDGQYCAWGVYHPEIFLANRIAVTTDHTSDAFLKACFKDAVGLITDESVEQMSEHDEQVLHEIAELHNRIAAQDVVAGSPQEVLKEWLFDLADKFYRDEELKGLFTR